jgi:hypothetical protein
VKALKLSGVNGILLVDDGHIDLRPKSKVLARFGIPFNHDPLPGQPQAFFGLLRFS